jgi:hypothetical protein
VEGNGCEKPSAIMNVKDDIVDESVPVAGRHHGDEADQILELSSSAASGHQHSPTSEDSSIFKSTKKPFKATGDSPQDDFEQEPQEEEEQKEDEDPAKRSSHKSDSTAATSAQAKQSPKKKGNWKKPPVRVISHLELRA